MWPADFIQMKGGREGPDAFYIEMRRRPSLSFININEHRA